MCRSYEQFRAQYLGRAKALCGSDRLEQAERICQLCYEQIKSNPDLLMQPRQINVRLAILQHDLFSRLETVEVLAQVIYPTIELPPHNNWISFDTCIKKLSPIVGTLPFHEQIILCLKFKGWSHGKIVNLFNEIIALLSAQIQSATNLAEADSVIKRFVQIFKEKVLVFLEEKEWFPKLFEYRENPSNDYESWQYLQKLCFSKKELRFARSRNPLKEKDAKIRDDLCSIRDRIHSAIKETDFFDLLQEGN